MQQRRSCNMKSINLLLTVTKFLWMLKNLLLKKLIVLLRLMQQLALQTVKVLFGNKPQKVHTSPALSSHSMNCLHGYTRLTQYQLHLINLWQTCTIVDQVWNNYLFKSNNIVILEIMTIKTLSLLLSLMVNIMIVIIIFFPMQTNEYFDLFLIQVSSIH